MAIERFGAKMAEVYHSVNSCSANLTFTFDDSLKGSQGKVMEKTLPGQSRLGILRVCGISPLEDISCIANLPLAVFKNAIYVRIRLDNLHIIPAWELDRGQTEYG